MELVLSYAYTQNFQINPSRVTLRGKDVLFSLVVLIVSSAAVPINTLCYLVSF